MHIKQFLFKRKRKPAVDDMQYAERFLIQQLQSVHFKADLALLVQNSNGDPLTSSRISRLDPFIDKDGLLRVGGRVKHSTSPELLCHPLIVSKKTHLSTLIISHCHTMCAHQRRGVTMAYIRFACY